MALWTPAEITTEGWFDAADADTVTLSGSEVTQWADKSGRGITTANAGGNPLWGDYGGYKAVRFSGAEYMNMSLAVEGVDHIFAFVTRKDSTAGLYPQILGGANNANYQFRQPDTEANLQVVGNPSTWENTTLGVANPGYNDVLFIFNGASSGATLRTNGSFDVTGGTQAGSREYARIGARDGGKDKYKGEIREIIVFSDASSVEKIEGYLAHKWGLEANLPAAHPYKTAAPQVAVEITGTGSPVTAGATATGVGEREVTGTGAATTAPATAEGNALRSITGSGTASTSPATAEGSAEREITATGIATTASITATGQAARIVAGQSVVILGAITATGNAARRVELAVPKWRITLVEAQSRVASVAARPRLATVVAEPDRIAAVTAQNRTVAIPAVA